MAASDEQTGRARWVVIGACALALGGAVALATSLGWTNGRVGTALLVASALVLLAVKLATDHLPDASRSQVVLACTFVVVIFAGVLGAAYTWGREDATAEAVELAPPEQRELGDLNSTCGAPDSTTLTGPRSSRIVAARVAATGEEAGDFVAALVTEPDPDSPYPKSETLVVLECDGTSWNVVSTEDIDARGCGTDLQATQLRSPSREEVLYTFVCGSGGFMDYKLIGHDQQTGRVGILLSEEAIMYGEATQIRDQLVIEGAGNLRIEMAWDGDKFVESEGSSLPAGEGLVIAFWWDDNGVGHADLTDVPVQVGERIYFRFDRERNTDESAEPYRIMRSGTPDDPVQRGEDERGEQYLSLSQPGRSVEFELVPNYADWDRSIIITVRS